MISYINWNFCHMKNEKCCNQLLKYIFLFKILLHISDVKFQKSKCKQTIILLLFITSISNNMFIWTDRWFEFFVPI